MTGRGGVETRPYVSLFLDSRLKHHCPKGPGEDGQAGGQGQGADRCGRLSLPGWLRPLRIGAARARGLAGHTD